MSEGSNRFTSDRRTPSGSSWSDDEDWAAGSLSNVEVVDGGLVPQRNMGSTETPDAEVTLPNGAIAYRWESVKGWNDWSGWTRVVPGDTELVSSPVHLGERALQVSVGDPRDSAIINDLSFEDSPTAGQINSYWGNERNHSQDIAGYFRWQDSDNFLVVTYNGINEVQLNEMSGGTGRTLTSVSTPVETPPVWVLHEVRLWEDSGTLYAEVESENDGIIGGQLSTTNHSITAGGAIGVGSSFFSSGRGNNGTLYTDTTAVYYPE